MEFTDEVCILLEATNYKREDILSFNEEILNNTGGLNGIISRLSLQFANGETKSFIKKVSNSKSYETSIKLGLSREALFYKELAPRLNDFGGICEVYVSQGNMETGEKLIILEDLKDSIQSGYFFGPGSPHNWGKDLDFYCSQAKGIDSEYITSRLFSIMGKFHGQYWNDVNLLKHSSWLKGCNWINKSGEESFHAAQNQALNCWKITKEKIENGTSDLNWDPFIVNCLDASFAKISWDKFLDELSHRPWTLAHGDFHPANTMYDVKNDRLFILDWEVVGVGSGPQDLGQFVISHTDPKERRLYEHKVVRNYYDALIECNKSVTYSYEECFAEYVKGGAERWVWLLALLSTMCPANMNNYFQAQVKEFLIDHHIDASNIGMPRV